MIKYKGDALSGSRTKRKRPPSVGFISQGRAGYAVLLLLVALVFGGGGSAAGLANLVVQLAGLAVLAFNRQAIFAFFAQAPRMPVILVAATLLLPLLQLVPLPPAIWQSLPGRDLAVQSYDLIGVQGAWRPFTLSVNRTAMAFFALLPPLAILVLSWDLPERQKRLMLQAVVVAGIIVMLLGAQQLATNNRLLVFYDEVAGSRNLQGTFANRNTAGLMLGIALVALVGAVPWHRAGPVWKLGSVAVAILLVIGVVLTGSRSSMTLLTVPALVAIWNWWIRRGAAHSRKMVVGAVLAVALVIGGGSFLLSGNQRVHQSLTRFDSVEDEERPKIWADTIVAIKRYSPLGAGIGSFDEVFQVDEALENVSLGRAGRAHNDFLEVTLESGIIGILLIGGWMVAVATLGFSARHGGVPLAAVGVLVQLALQSLTDYPLRSQTLLCIAALMFALLLGTREGRSAHEGGLPDRI
ncbi:O-antigen ligase [Novosphingobium sp. PhB165]|uniref:O-antigen ligase family protein n=1 Tax=Novosphingobium sp. PhB165 TaxID=2485105 RepID=UPI00104F490C|nr:O-antigen ligase family protein [Novosphingobium sp. PhB165]TCM17832.1 O-antigen ligase [Novosphingobium sp. PhB165]